MCPFLRPVGGKRQSRARVHSCVPLVASGRAERTVIYVAPQAKREYDIINIMFMNNYGLKINICSFTALRRISVRETTCCSSRND